MYVLRSTSLKILFHFPEILSDKKIASAKKAQNGKMESSIRMKDKCVHRDRFNKCVGGCAHRSHLKTAYKISWLRESAGNRLCGARNAEQPSAWHASRLYRIIEEQDCCPIRLSRYTQRVNRVRAIKTPARSERRIDHSLPCLLSVYLPCS